MALKKRRGYMEQQDAPKGLEGRMAQTSLSTGKLLQEDDIWYYFDKNGDIAAKPGWYWDEESKRMMPPKS